MQALWFEGTKTQKKRKEGISMKSKLIEEWVKMGLSPSKDFDFFTKRDYAVVGKLKDKQALVEYECPYCNFYEIKEIELEKSGKKFKRPKFKCSECDKTITVESLRKK
jgi:formylmethanofuran dehydrogenase subunit E